ncbi:D-arabinono-1,4-lactone oxidase [Purpureocillium lavendulum]|uniref:Rab proteins geranylgeranyltransferase n=1 Tax=Purpureocillium lavendulum TaxID=1247861 RepID=A0AB34G6S9_9HYPO|nr:D-arabinono-1,4-lactone oxidase [Purpureocillium lavendulum]
MESLSDTKWDVVISGTGLQQSLLALALSRSGKHILHVDPSDYYGGPEAALSLQEADEWAERHSSVDGDGAFAGAQVTRADDGLSFPRAYSLALAPQLIHARSELLSQLVSSKAFRQIEFLAVGSFFIYQPPSDSAAPATLSRIPSTREDVFANRTIPARSKRALMKFLKFVLEFDSEAHAEIWKPKAKDELASFLESEFRLDRDLQSYVVTLTLSLDGKISVEDGLNAINRHLTSMGVFGTGFAAVYPKWGGLSEIAQVGCRAAAVGGAVYILGAGISAVQTVPAADDASEDELLIKLTNDVEVKSKTLVQESTAADGPVTLSRLVAVVQSSMHDMFEATVEGAPTPCVAVVAFPPGSLKGSDGTTSDHPVYASVHSSDTGECPSGQSIVYLNTVSSPASGELLESALSSFLQSLASDQEPPKTLYRLRYEQRGGSGALSVDGRIGSFGLQPQSLAFGDSRLAGVRQAWDMVVGGDGAVDEMYMQFEDREGADDEDDAFGA